MVGSIFRLSLYVAVLAIATAGMTHGRAWQWPDRHNPWAQLRIEDRPGWLTRYKLARLTGAPADCRDVLETSRLKFAFVVDRVVGTGCGFDNAVRVTRTSAQVGEPFILSCRAAVSLALWEHHVLQPAAQSLLGSTVRRIDYYGSFACRNVNGRSEGRRSQHATADALDVAGFVLEDGRRITVASHWQGKDERAAFLVRIHGQACGFFDSVLGPEYDAAHADHLHLDRGPFRVCR